MLAVLLTFVVVYLLFAVVRATLHTHHWVMLDAHVGLDEVTVLLTRCRKCGAVKSEMLQGVWTADQLRQSPKKLVDDLISG